MKNILVPTDFSDEAKTALDFAVQLADKSNGSVYILHVLELPSSSLSIVGDLYAGSAALDQVYNSKLVEVLKENMDDQVRFAKNHGITVQNSIEYGNVYRKIEDVSKEINADLIVMGTKGVSGWQEVLVGSNAEKIIRRSKIPVLTIKHPLKLDQLKNMVFAIGETTDRSVAFVKEFQKLVNATCHLLKVFRPVKMDSKIESAKTEVSEFAESTGFTDYTTNVVEAPWVEEGILEFVEGKSYDLIAMGTHGYKGLNHFLLGSHAEDVSNHAELPVLSINVS